MVTSVDKRHPLLWQRKGTHNIVTTKISAPDKRSPTPILSLITHYTRKQHPPIQTSRSLENTWLLPTTFGLLPPPMRVPKRPHAPCFHTAQSNWPARIIRATCQIAFSVSGMPDWTRLGRLHYRLRDDNVPSCWPWLWVPNKIDSARSWSRPYTRLVSIFVPPQRVLGG